jgi:hypothetical protein
MKIYHYTNIESLALILHNRTIRFTRLDAVDDPNEYQFVKDGINPAQYVYVSCWTKSKEENIPQWKMYGANGRGVRIGLDESMFPFVAMGVKSNFYDNQFFYDRDYYILPFLQEKLPLYDIVYVEDPNEKTNLIFQQQNEQSAIDFKQMGLYKSKDWIFQKECRFKMFVVPKKKNSNQDQSFSELLSNNISLNRNYLDMPLAENVYNEMEVMVGPNVSQAECIIVQSLLQRYIGHETILKSVFTGKYH